jgi:hypothetical protein
MYNTTTMREATHAAKRLVLLYHQRRTSDVTLLGEALSSYQETGFNEHEFCQTLNPWPTDQEIPWLMDLVGGLSRLEGMTFGDDLFVGDINLN